MKMNVYKMDTQKKLNYSIYSDELFIAINVLIILVGLERNKKKKFKYPQKLAALILFINNRESIDLFQLICDEKYKLKLLDIELLSNIFLKSKLMESDLNRVLNKLEKQGLIKKEHDEKFISLIYDEEKALFANNEQFQFFLDNAKLLKNKYSYISSVKYETFVEKVFKGISYESIKNN